MHLRQALTVLTVALFLVSGPITAQAQTPDRIYMTGQQSPKMGRVVEEPLNHLVWKPKSEQGNSYFDARETSWNKIRGIRFGEQPDNYETARSLHEQGQELDRAVSLLEEIIENKEVNRTFFIPRALYLIADIRYQQASGEEGYRTALDAYNKAIDRYPDNRGYFNALQRKIELHRKLDQLDEALSAADQLIERDPRQRGVTIGSMIKTEIFMEQGKHEEALKTSQKVLNTADTAYRKIRAKQLVAENQLRLEQYEKAISHYREFIEQQDRIPERIRDQLLTAAHNGLGRAYYQQNYTPNASKDSVRRENVQVLKDALLHFMKGVVWFRSQGGDSVERERSLYWVARCFADLAENVSEQERVDKYTMEARRAINTLLNRYPESQFRRKVQRISDRL